jgi:hypothetical protein
MERAMRRKTSTGDLVECAERENYDVQYRICLEKNRRIFRRLFDERMKSTT